MSSRFFDVSSYVPEQLLDERIKSLIAMYEERRGGNIEELGLREDSRIIRIEMRASTLHIPSELWHEWPEVISIFKKLSLGKRLSEHDKLWINELAEATGWAPDHIIDEIRNLDIDPSERAKRYRELFEQYYREALIYKGKGDTRQAGEKIWGAVVALIKFYAAVRGVFISHWSRGKLDKFITNNVRQEYREHFRNLLDKAHRLHEHFYEGDLDEKSFKERWEKLMELLENVKKIVFESS